MFPPAGFFLRVAFFALPPLSVGPNAQFTLNPEKPFSQYICFVFSPRLGKVFFSPSSEFLPPTFPCCAANSSAQNTCRLGLCELNSLSKSPPQDFSVVRTFSYDGPFLFSKRPLPELSPLIGSPFRRGHPNFSLPSFYQIPRPLLPVLQQWDRLTAIYTVSCFAQVLLQQDQMKSSM